MSGNPNSDRRTERRQETVAEIVAAAWDLVREHGLAGLSMRDLGNRVGMKAQSLYSYFSSKNEIYDAMFHEGYEQFAARMAALGDADGTETELARRGAHLFFDFCTSDTVRYQLLFQRTIPGFEPSETSWAVAVQAYDVARAQLGRAGLHGQQWLDIWTAVLTGLTDQQISNDPGGDRWERLIDQAVDMVLAAARADTTTLSQKG